MRQKKRAAAVLLSAVMAFSAVSPAVPVWAASWQKNASGSYIGSDGSVLTGILSRGIDVSQWQQNINWSAVADDDIQFAMIGTRYNNAVDPYFDTNVRGAAAAGLRVGVYLYSYATTTAMAESDADWTGSSGNNSDRAGIRRSPDFLRNRLSFSALRSVPCAECILYRYVCDEGKERSEKQSCI